MRGTPSSPSIIASTQVPFPLQSLSLVQSSPLAQNAFACSLTAQSLSSPLHFGRFAGGARFALLLASFEQTLPSPISESTQVCPWQSDSALHDRAQELCSSAPGCSRNP